MILQKALNAVSECLSSQLCRLGLSDIMRGIPHLAPSCILYLIHLLYLLSQLLTHARTIVLETARDPMLEVVEGM